MKYVNRLAFFFSCEARELIHALGMLLGMILIFPLRLEWLAKPPAETAAVLTVAAAAKTVASTAAANTTVTSTAVTCFAVHLFL